MRALDHFLCVQDWGLPSRPTTRHFCPVVMCKMPHIPFLFEHFKGFRSWVVPTVTSLAHLCNTWQKTARISARSYAFCAKGLVHAQWKNTTPKKLKKKKRNICDSPPKSRTFDEIDLLTISCVWNHSPE